MDGGEQVTIKVVERIGAVDAADWDACAGPENPFVSHAFLSALEEAGAVSADTGWLPQHLVMEDGGGKIVGCVPAYVKSHSYGEYVFDWGWAEAFERAGGRYYPKLQVAVPFSPVTGPRLLVRPGPDAAARQGALVGGLMEIARRAKVSSLHITFPTEPEWKMLGEIGLMQRMGQQFHWHNRGYETFDDFLAQLTSRKRKSIRKERRDANEMVKIEVLSGDDLKAKHMEAFYRFYMNTVNRRWANDYLNREFFQRLRETMADKIVLVLAAHDGEYVAGAINLAGADTLFGRNWGCAARFPMLYFECCFYRAIDYAIAHKLPKVEAGAQGPHKISRGYLPSPTYSAHWIRDNAFKNAVADFLKRERRQVEHQMDALEEERSPYRSTEHDGQA
jgi:predicted N-acyltransferase